MTYEKRIKSVLRMLRQKDGEYPGYPCIVSSQKFFDACLAEASVPDPEILALMKRRVDDVVFEGRAWFIDDTIPSNTFQVEMYASSEKNPRIHNMGKFDRWTVD